MHFAREQLDLPIRLHCLALSAKVPRRYVRPFLVRGDPGSKELAIARHDLPERSIRYGDLRYRCIYGEEILDNNVVTADDFIDSSLHIAVVLSHDHRDDVMVLVAMRLFDVERVDILRIIVSLG